MSVNINSTKNIFRGNTWSHDDICDKAYQKKGVKIELEEKHV